MPPLAESDWNALKREMRDLLINLARAEKTIAYSELAASLKTAYIHYRAPAFGQILRDLAAEDRAAERPMLATLVVNKATGRPGIGYYKHLMDAGKSADDLEAYWLERFHEVCDYWQTHDDPGS